ncbi:MAG: prephenate dehydrogenase/arogenate dehydrogenase family protein [Kiritimatiellae bacterium]|nr:prephenate dehydrogenase/arogenate dehydrogenase family protein [Kiritimatiellia bacterium]
MRMNVTIVGLGLIGGSLAKAAALAGHSVRAVTRTPPQDAPFPVCRPEDGRESIALADLVLVALPPAAVVPWIEANESNFKKGAVVVDATGVKAKVCEALRKYALQDRWTFVGGHPMAGKEVGGFTNSAANLFVGASMILTPYPSCGRGPLDMLEAFFKELGFGRVVFTTPEHHDRMIALTSQLAHVVSSAYARDPLALEHVGFSAGSFHDMTRVARLDPDVWTDLFLANREALLDVLDGLLGRLADFRSALDATDAAAMRDMLAEGRAARLKACGMAMPPDEKGR